MLCPLCFRDLAYKDDRIYVSYAEPTQPIRTEELKGLRELEPDPKASVVRERLVAHELCDCLHPLVDFGTKTVEAAALLYKDTVQTQEVRGLIAGSLGDAHYNSIFLESGYHWSAVRMNRLVQNFKSVHSMWFPERLLAWPSEPDKRLSILMVGPAASGKSVLTVLSGSQNAYDHLGNRVAFQENFGYSSITPGDKPYLDYSEMLKNLTSARFSTAVLSATSALTTSIVATFFSKPLPNSAVETVVVYDMAGEMFTRGLSRASTIQGWKLYWCLVISADDLTAFRDPGTARKNLNDDSVALVLRKLQEAEDDQRIVLIVTKMDTVNWDNVEGIDQQNLKDIRQMTTESVPLHSVPEGFEAVQKAHRDLGVRGNFLLSLVLDQKVRIEASLRYRLEGASKVRAVFFTGAEGWGTPNAMARPFGIGEAVCWMAEDLINEPEKAPSAVGSILTRALKMMGGKGRAL